MRSQSRSHEKVRKRSDDMLIIRGTNVFPSQVEDILSGIKGSYPRFYRIEVDNETGLDRMKIKVEIEPSALSDSYEEMDRFRKMIATKLKKPCL